MSQCVTGRMQASLSCRRCVYAQTSANVGAFRPAALQRRSSNRPFSAELRRNAPGVCVARWYDPNTGEFLSVDPAFNATLDAYGYADENPLDGTDPSGLYGCLPGKEQGPCQSKTTDTINIKLNVSKAKVTDGKITTVYTAHLSITQTTTSWSGNKEVTSSKTSNLPTYTRTVTSSSTMVPATNTQRNTPGSQTIVTNPNLPGGTVTDCYGTQCTTQTNADVACVGGLGPDRNGGICNADPNGYYNTTDPGKSQGADPLKLANNINTPPPPSSDHSGFLNFVSDLGGCLMSGAQAVWNDPDPSGLGAVADFGGGCLSSLADAPPGY